MAHLSDGSRLEAFADAKELVRWVNSHQGARPLQVITTGAGVLLEYESATGGGKAGPGHGARKEAR